jgi:hypothetical protein
MPTLYLETNFLIGIATGRDADAYSLVSAPSPGLHIAMPGVCFMEALSWLETERKRKNEFDTVLKVRVHELTRDLTSPHAQPLRSHLQQSVFGNADHFNDVERRLFDAIRDLPKRAELIELDPGIIESSVLQAIIEEDPTDNLILHGILHHAALHPGEEKVLLTGNTKDFGTADVKKLLRDAGIAKQFAETRPLLNWLGSRPSP